MEETLRVLVVDDVQDSREILEQLLLREGYRVDLAEDGPTALSKAEIFQPDVVLLDIYMPEMDGWEVCRRLKEQQSTRDIPIIFLTAAYLNEEHIVRGLETGAYDYITKPFRAAELNARISVMAQINRTQKGLKEASLTDELSGLANRRHGFERLEEEFSRARRYKAPLAVLLMDIDHFKVVNDTHGHGSGDTVIRGMGSILSDFSRTEDIPARVGGDEFMLVAVNTDVLGARRMANRIRQIINDRIFPSNGDGVRVTVCIGVAGREGHPTMESMYEAADKALYAAKSMGRNCVAAEGDTAPQPQTATVDSD